VEKENRGGHFAKANYRTNARLVSLPEILGTEEGIDALVNFLYATRTGRKMKKRPFQDEAAVDGNNGLGRRWAVKIPPVFSYFNFPWASGYWSRACCSSPLW
jgi:hypothetical protein